MDSNDLWNTLPRFSSLTWKCYGLRVRLPASLVPFVIEHLYVIE